MKIVQVNTHDLAGGAAKLTHQLHQNFLKLGHEASMLVRHKTSDEKEIYSTSRNKRRIQSYLQQRFPKLPTPTPKIGFSLYRRQPLL